LQGRIVMQSRRQGVRELDEAAVHTLLTGATR
jgi:hypothetical protein